MRSLVKAMFGIAVTVCCSGCIVTLPLAVWGLAGGANGINKLDTHIACKAERETQASNPPIAPYNWTDHDPSDDMDGINPEACQHQKPFVRDYVEFYNAVLQAKRDGKRKPPKLDRNMRLNIETELAGTRIKTIFDSPLESRLWREFQAACQRLNSSSVAPA
jgi:hypothetical protein